MQAATLDTRAKIGELERLLASGDGAALQSAVDAAFLALEFRATDEMIGLEPVAPELLAELRGLACRGLLRAAQQAPDSERTERVLAAVQRLRLASEVGLAEQALHALGTLPERADVLYERALCAFNGFGANADHVAALKLHERAGELGSADALFELYCMHARGLGTSENLARALEYCTRAAELGQIRAMYNLGAHHASGNGVTQNDTLARRWYERAAEAGHGRAAAVAGIMHGLEQGEGSSDAEAERFFSLADKVNFDWRPLADASGLDPEAFDAFHAGASSSGMPW
jgi:TPR repeat protein